MIYVIMIYTFILGALIIFGYNYLINMEDDK